MVLTWHSEAESSLRCRLFSFPFPLSAFKRTSSSVHIASRNPCLGELFAFCLLKYCFHKEYYNKRPYKTRIWTASLIISLEILFLSQNAWIFLRFLVIIHEKISDLNSENLNLWEIHVYKMTNKCVSKQILIRFLFQ